MAVGEGGDWPAESSLGRLSGAVLPEEEGCITPTPDLDDHFQLSELTVWIDWQGFDPIHDREFAVPLL